jgi:hypothetical protein
VKGETSALEVGLAKDVVGSSRDTRYWRQRFEGVVPLSSKRKVQAARHTMVKRKMYRNGERASAGRIGSRVSLKRSKQKCWQLLTVSLRCRKPDVRSRGWRRLNENLLKVLRKGDIGAKEIFSLWK